MVSNEHPGADHIPHGDPIELVGAFRFCPSCGNPVLAKDDHGVTPEQRIREGTLAALEEIHCSKCYLAWRSCTCGIHR
jgi:hypothetical protein